MSRWLNIFFVFSLLLAPLAGISARPAPEALAQTPDVNAIVAAMTPAEKVGQLFIVGFYGASANEGSDIYRLITEYHVGGVILSAATDNITDTLDAPTQVLSLTNQLQSLAVQLAQVPRAGPGSVEGDPTLPPYVPLLVAMNHEGNGAPTSEIQTGLTSVPSAMAIGATWDPTHAESMGRIVGTELSALGINLLLGPSLDVLETPRPDGADLGTRVFGGDPYWVGVIGEAYIRGVHFGSSNGVGVIAKHFPGIGGSDRRPELELPTVRKSIEDLKSFDLVPFYQVFDGLPSEGAPGNGVADGVLSAHIRFQGFQGDIRTVTPPVSLDQAAFGALLQLPQVDAWRQGGGITVSDSLGSRAVKQVYAAERFNNRRIAGEAFRAGNDLLLLTDFGLNPRVEQMSNIVDTVTFFHGHVLSAAVHGRPGLCRARGRGRAADCQPEAAAERWCVRPHNGRAAGGRAERAAARRRRRAGAGAGCGRPGEPDVGPAGRARARAAGAR
jgi:beta-N-acetylhexosaminidase